jgi:ATP-binding cassette subfamily B multidrug efflux pump
MMAGAAGRRPPPRPMGGPFGGVGLPAEKPKNFKRTFRRLVKTLSPELPKILLVVAFAIVSVTFAVVGPKILGNATDILFNGVVSQQIPAGLTKEQAVAALNAAGQTQQAQMLASMNVTPGAGVDFTALRNTLLVVAVIYIFSSVFSWAQANVMAGVSQRTVYRMRRDVDEKLSRMPLRYFDGHPRGDTLSRVTNDIDNIANSLQQTMTQLITAVCTIIGVLAMMI